MNVGNEAGEEIISQIHKEVEKERDIQRSAHSNLLHSTFW